MNKIFKSFPATIVSLLIGVTIFAVSLVLGLDIFEEVIALLEDIEHLELDEVIIPLFIFMIGVSIDSYRRYVQKNRLALITETKLESLKTVMRTVQDIIGNFMNNLILYRMEAKETGSLSEKSINELEALVQCTTKKINELAEVKEIREKELGDKMYVIDVVEEDKNT